MAFNHPFPGIHEQFKNSLQAYTGKSLNLAHEELLLSLEFFSLALLFYWLAVLIRFIENSGDMPKQKSIVFFTMEGLAFALGVPRYETKSQKRLRIQKEKEYKRKVERRKKRKESTLLVKRPSWRVIPSHQCSGLSLWIDLLRGDTFFTKRSSLLEEMAHIKNPLRCEWNFPIQRALRDDYLEKATKVLHLLYSNQEVRWTFKRFFSQIRIQKFKAVNDKDPFTLDAIKEPVLIYSFPHRIAYQFEAETISKSIHKQLILNDGQIPTPQMPKNPFTNEDFTLAQLMGIFNQFKKFGHTSWAIEAFLSARFDMITFAATFSKALRLQALRTTMAKVEDWDCIDTLLDFIKSQHAFHGKSYRQSIYRWAVHNKPNEKRMASWRKLCLKWYETNILMEDTEMRDALYRILENKTKLLCSAPNELIILKELQKISPTQVDGGGSN